MAEKKLKVQKSQPKADRPLDGKVKSSTKKKTGELKLNTEVKIEKAEKKVAKKDSLSLDVYGKDGQVVGSINLPKEIFDTKVNNDLMAQAVRVYLANQRSGTAHTKTRGEVRGSTRKIYRQKGTGRARHGAITAPIFVGGGIAFGPRKRDLSLAFPKKMKRKALFSALTLKLKNNNIKILDELENLDAKTKNMQNVLKSLDVLNKKGKAEKILFVISKNNENIERAVGNIGGISLTRAENINTYSVLDSKKVVFMKNSVESLPSIFLNSSPVQSGQKKTNI